VPVTGGGCKLQWKCDWAMRWVALGVDYEMSGKDLIDSVRLSAGSRRSWAAAHPRASPTSCSSTRAGEKISKSKGNGLSVEDWLAYAPPESLSLYMYQQPRRAKRLYFDVIPRAVDEYWASSRSTRPRRRARSWRTRPGTSMAATRPPPRCR
jgi:lysyl-tRNA synthetase class 1